MSDGQTCFFSARSKQSILTFCLLAIVVIGTHATSWGEPAPANEPPSQATAPAVEIPPGSSPAPPEAPLTEAPAPEAVVSLKKAQESLLRESFSYSPAGMVDPFVPFIAPVAIAPPKHPDAEIVEEAEPVVEPEQQKPLTPLQRMSLGEIEKGLKAITWGELGRRALIEDAAGKGYIVSVGTPAGDKNGMISQIFNDHLVIQQEVWDRESKRMVPQSSVVRLWKEKK